VDDVRVKGDEGVRGGVKSMAVADIMGAMEPDGIDRGLVVDVRGMSTCYVKCVSCPGWRCDGDGDDKDAC
jgi:hypothetical protein